MPRKRLSMRQVHAVLRLKWAGGLSDRQIAQSRGRSRPTVAADVRRAQAAGVAWPLPSGLDETALDRLLFPLSPARGTTEPLAPDWSHVHHALKRQGVPWFLLWQAYKATTPDGFQDSWFCKAYRAWAGRLDVVRRQDHRAGETLFVDSAGPTLPIVNRPRGEVHEAQVFIAVLGASNDTSAEVTWTQRLPDWIGSPVRTFEALGGVPEVVLPDNLKAAVNRAHRYAPELNRTYAELAHHSGVAVIPARALRPRDKATVEVGVQGVERWMLARLRHDPFFSLPQAHQASADLLSALNSRPFKKLPGSRQRLFDSLDRPALRPLPAQPYAYAEWKRARVNIDDPVEVEGHSSSVPYTLVKQPLDVRLTPHGVALLSKGKRVASHRRSPLKGRHTPVAAHMPTAHRQYAEWTPQRLITWAASSGGATSRVVETMLESRPPPQHGVRSCLGMMRLGKRYGAERLEAACRRALQIGACSYKSIASMRKQGLENPPVPSKAKAQPVLDHANSRGPKYYQSGEGPSSCEPIPLSTHSRA